MPSHSAPLSPSTQAIGQIVDPVTGHRRGDASDRGAIILGVVSFLNARPLVESLIGRDDVRIEGAVPSALAAMLEEGAVDVALLPVIDYWRRRNRLRLVTDACIASDGETMTVRVYSRVPPDRVHKLHADVDSHTSVRLAAVVWAELYGRSLEIEPYDRLSPPEAEAVEAVLLIGDKVVSHAPRGFGFEVDLGGAWKHLTGLPFVFAAWAAPKERDVSHIVTLLETARDRGVAEASRIAAEYGPLHGWPVETAKRYLCEVMQYKMTDAMREGMGRFFELAEKKGSEGWRGEGSGGLGIEKSIGHEKPLAANSGAYSSCPSNGPVVEPSNPSSSSPSNPSRYSTDDLRAMYLDLSIHDLGRKAFETTERLHPEDYRTYVVDRNINYANWCTAKCIFCNFKADPPEMNSGRADLPSGYTLSFEDIGHKIEELIAIGGTQILMQGGLVPADGSAGLSFDWYLDLMRFIRKNYPTIHIHAFSPPEIFAFHQVFGMSIRDVLLRLRDAGLDTVPGGGGEILADRVRKKIGIGKTLTDEWLEVMRQCHAIGMKTSSTMMFGHMETLDERLEHLRLLRDLQDGSLARGNDGGFSAFICWTFQPDNTPLGRMKRMPNEAVSDQLSAISQSKAGEAGEVSHSRARRVLNDGRHLLLADAHEYLTMLALSRLYLDNIPNIQSSWVTMGPKIGQLALFFGANDMGSVMMEENVVSAAGTTYCLNEPEIRRLITDAGWRPEKRDYFYRPIGDEQGK